MVQYFNISLPSQLSLFLHSTLKMVRHPKYYSLLAERILLCTIVLDSKHDVASLQKKTGYIARVTDNQNKGTLLQLELWSIIVEFLF